MTAAGEHPRGPGTSLVRLEAITKAYPGVLANDDVSFELRAGEIHALLGENGAGKSTLMGIFYGLHRPDAGRILLDDEEVAITEPRDAMALGVGYVQQHFSLVPTLTVAENLVLGLRFSGRRLSLREGQATVRELSAQYGLDVRADIPIDELSIGMQQRAELLKALARSPRVLILDEPSSLLSPQESEQLTEVIRQLASEGLGIILISHKLDEVLAVADRISVLRHGRHVRTLDGSEATRALLGELMIGGLHAPEAPPGHDDSHSGELALDIVDLSADGDRGEPALRGVSLRARRGEILGIAGVEGSGQVELIETIAGVRKATGGAVRLAGRDLAGCSVSERQRRGIGHVPADRRRDGLVASLSVMENLSLAVMDEGEFSRFGVLRRRAVRRHAERLIERFDIRVPSPDVPVSSLSGGNQQKVIVARELSREPTVVLTSYPTWGLDIAAAASVHGELTRRRNQGAAVLLASMDLDELLSVADRILVMQGGRISGEVSAADASPEQIGLLMGGAAE